jgi:glycosyltransferase involved in cell wall biosynthesis
VGSIPEIVGDQINGLVIPIGDQTALMQAIQFLSENPAIRRVMGNHSRRLVIERHNIESLFRALGNIYRELIPI